ncbi:MAG: glycosyltransferase family 9 protein [Legionellaceae bacterium]|nr:glycosyltransferase family 9 protein [Legionellaceae bacterium]
MLRLHRKKARLNYSAIRSLCILRLSSIGDVTHVIPVILNIQQQAPHIKITWIIRSSEANLIRNLPGVEFIILNKKTGLRSLLDIRNHLKSKHFDVLLHMQVAGRANIVAALTPAAIKIGFDKTRSRDLHQCVIHQSITSLPKQHVRDAFTSFLTHLEIPLRAQKTFIPLAEEDQHFARMHIVPHRCNIIVSPCSRHTLRNWLPERYAELADYAITRYDAQVIFVGSVEPLEQQFIKKITDYMTQPALNLAGKDTLKKLSALIAEADLLIAPDTGATHIASIVGTDVLGLYAASNPYRTGPYHSIEWCVNRYPEAAQRFLGVTVDECRWGRKIEFPGVMDLISVDDTKNMLDTWMSQKFHRRVPS